MVKKINHKEKKYFQCDICKFYYNTKELDQECENFCRTHKSYSLETPKILEVEFLGALKNANYSVLDVTKHAIKLK